MNCKLAVTALLALTLAAGGVAASEPRFLKKVVVKPGLVAVVAEGDFEARSIGSYSVRAYWNQEAKVGDDTTFFTAGVLRPRDGTIESASMIPTDAGNESWLVIVVRSSGSGGYLSADAFSISEHSVALRASVSGLRADADPVAALERTARRGGS